MATATEKGFYGTGRRKEATARVWIRPGTGVVIVNGRDINVYFGRETSKMILNQPLDVLEQKGKIDIEVNVRGGGLSVLAVRVRSVCVLRRTAWWLCDHPNGDVSSARS